MSACSDRNRLWNILPSMVRHYRLKREVLGYNRVRIVISCDRPEDLRAAVLPLYAGLAGVDDRMHLHLVTPATLAVVT